VSEDIVFRDRGALLNFVENNVTDLSASSNISASAFYGDGENLTNILADHVDVTSSAGNIAYNIVFTEGFQTDGSTGLAGNANISFNASTNKLALNASLETGPVGITGSLGVSGSTTLGDASGDTVTINGIVAGTDNSVIVIDGSGVLKHDEIDSRVWGTTLVDGTNGTDNEIAIFTDSNSVEGDANLTWDGSTLDVAGALTVDGNTTLGDAYTDTVTIQAATTTLIPTGNNLPQLKLESKNGTANAAGEIRFERYDDAVIQAGESLGEVIFDATETDDGTYYSAAMITGEVGTGTWTDGSSRPGALRFWTCADGGTTLIERMSIESDGVMSASVLALDDQPAFSAYSGGNQTLESNIWVTLSGSLSEVFDTQGDFNTTNGTFTAPIDGKYLLTFSARIDGIDQAGTQYTWSKIITSNRTYFGSLQDVAEDGVVSYFTYHQSVIADMEASDTAYVQVYIRSGTANTETGNTGYVTLMGWMLG